jgi:hypothetical protein
MEDAPVADLGDMVVAVTPQEKRHSATIYC